MGNGEGIVIGTNKHNSGRSDLLECSSATVSLLTQKYQTSEDGLTSIEAKIRLDKYGFNEPISIEKRGLFYQLLEKIANPLSISLIIIAILVYFFGQRASAMLIIGMALLSILLSFVQEYKAGKDAEKLQDSVRITTRVIRDGKIIKIKLKDVVPGDLIDLESGNMVPADVRIISSAHLYINESALTGESFPVEKSEIRRGVKYASISELANIGLMGTSVVSGSGRGLVVATGADTEFGRLASEIASGETETSFNKGIKRFVWMMLRYISLLALFIFLVVALLKGNPLQALLFSLAVAIGLAPEMLPMIVTVNLSKGAIKMAKKGVIVKRLDSIQNFGAMDVLCTDKTGTLTLNDIKMVKHCDVAGEEKDEVLKYVFINSHFQSGLSNLLDQAILKHEKFNLPKNIKKIHEIPYDFSRRMVSIAVKYGEDYELVVKGAPEDVFERICSYELDGKTKKVIQADLTKFKKLYDDFSKDGFRVLAVAYKKINQEQQSFSTKDETDLILIGFVAFLDPAKPTVKETINSLEALGINLKILSGDNELVTEKICSDVELSVEGMLTGQDIEKLNDDELRSRVDNVTVFARLDPIQKERVMKSLQSNGHTVGFLGDGINDSPSLKIADLGISVNNAVDIAKETASIILLQNDLMVLESCVEEGRRTFGNVVKYIKMGSSSNFGNMLSMAGASIFLPFLPMMPIQILLNNFLYDFSQITIPSDTVDKDYLSKPRPWNIKFIKKFMLYMGPVSSIFDFITFGILLLVLRADMGLFQTGWFIESLCTQVLIIHVIRTNKIPFIQSRASFALLATTLLVVLIGCILPFTSLGAYFGFVRPPLIFFLIILIIVIIYLALTQVMKQWFIKRFGYE